MQAITEWNRSPIKKQCGEHIRVILVEFIVQTSHLVKYRRPLKHREEYWKVEKSIGR